jgi:hypothetical protein
MGLKTLIVATLAAFAVAKPIPDPLHVMRQSGPAAGQVRSHSAGLSLALARAMSLGYQMSGLTTVTGLHQVRRSRSNRTCVR